MKKLRLLLAISAIVASSVPIGDYTVAKADSNYYTEIMDDLTNADDFDPSSFPLVPLKDDYSNASISLMDFKENSRGQIILYVYNPTGAAEACRVNISLKLDNPEFTQYNLTLLSSSDSMIFQKYLVEGLAVDNTLDTRYYYISSIYRKPFEVPGELIPDKYGQTSSAIAYTVGKTYRVTKDKEYMAREHKVIEITDKFLANILCNNAKLYIPFMTLVKQNLNFVSFNTNISIDDLYEIEINYDIYDFTIIKAYPPFGSSYFYEGSAEYSNKVEIRNQVFISEDAYDVYEGWWTNNRTHKMKNIVRTSDLLDKKSENYDSNFDGYDKSNDLAKYEWTLFFYSCDYTLETIRVGDFVTNTEERVTTKTVKDMTILRLKFLSDGEVYNLGVVDDVSTGPRDPLTRDPSTNWLLIIVLVILAVCVLIALLPQLIMSILGAFFKFINFLAKGMVAVVKAPFKAAGKAFKNRKSRRKY